jgi:hypothetical protein
MTVISGLGAIAYRQWIHKPDIQITDQAKVPDGQAMQDGMQAIVQIPGTPPARRYLAITPTLTNTQSVGNCVGSALLDITLVVDGRRGFEQSEWPPDHELRLDLKGTTQEARVLVTVHMDDTACKVNLGLKEAVLYN